MLGIDRRAAHYAWTAALVLVLLYLVFILRTTLFVFILAVLFAYLLSPLVNLLDRFLPTRTRTPALTLAYIIFVGVAITLGMQIGSRVVDEATRLGKDLPADIEKWKTISPGTGILDQYKVEIIEKIQTEISTRASDVLSMAAQAGVKFLTVASSVIYIVIIPILAFFFLKDGRAIRQHILELVEDGPRRLLLDEVLADLDILLAHYMRALVILSLAAFTAYSVFFSIMGVPYAVLLGALGGILEFIPMLGPLTAGVAIVLVAALSGSHGVAVLIFLLAYRVFQDYILSPHLMGQGVELHPLLVLFGVFGGAEVAGIAGTFLSVPILALVRILYLRIRKARLTAHLAPTPTAEVTL
ncbi:MAG: AI-2E family transporter [Acidobacteriia bacterium]|nr:AI-2E family transporter [Terriglobia bacterium]